MDNTAQPNTPPISQSVSPPPSPTPPAKPSHSRNNLILAGLVAAVLLVVLAAGVYIFAFSNKPKTPVPVVVAPTTAVSPTTPPTSSPDITADWKTYTSTESGYSIKYPSDKLVRLACPDEELDLVKKDANNADQDSVPLPTCGRDGRFLMELRTINKQDSDVPQDKEHYDIKSETIKVNGMTAVKYTYKQIKPFEGQGGSSWYQLVDIMRPSGVFELYLDNEDFIPIRDQMLTTFKLIK